MANEHNLKPVRSKSEARERGRNGGIKSGATRRRKAALRDTMNRLLTMQVEVDGLSDILRADGGESTYEEVITMAMIQQAMLGDVKAYQAIMKTVGQTDKSAEDLEEQKSRTDRAKRARDQEVGDTDSQDDNIQSFLKAMRPTAEIDSLVETNDQNFGEQLCDRRWIYPIGKDDCLYYWLSNLVTRNVLW